MRWLKWFRRKEEKSRLKLSFEYDGERLFCNTEWPVGRGQETDEAIVCDFSQILALLGQGRLFTKAQAAIVAAGVRTGDRRVAEAIMAETNAIMSHFQGAAQTRDDSDDPLVPAVQCFPSTRNNSGGQDDE